MNNLPIRVQKLNQLELADDLPVAESGPISLNYVSNYDSNFEDYGPFCTGLSRFLEEALLIKKFNEIVDEGIDIHASMLYTWRSLSRPISKIEVAPDDKTIFNDYQLEMLEAPMQSLFKFYFFVEDAQKEFINIVTKCCRQDQYFTSEGVLLSIGRMVNMFIIVDDLRGAKTSLKNDLSHYKRLHTVMKKNVGDAEFASNISKITLFLAQPNMIINSIKNSLGTISDSWKIIMGVIAVYAERLENRVYFSPSDKYSNIRIILGCLLLVCGEKNVAGKLDQMKIPLARLDKLLRESPNIPLIGDMHSSVGLTLKRFGLNFEFSLLDQKFLATTAVDYDITRYVDEFESAHISLLSELHLLTRTMSVSQTYNGLYDLHITDATRLYYFAEKALKTLGRWTYILHEVFFYKMSHPIDRSKLTNITGEVDSYSLATKYNYTIKEKAAICRIAFLIKSMYKVLKKHENILVNAIYTFIYTCFQNFIHKSAKDLIKKANKSKVAVFNMVVETLKMICADRIDSTDQSKSKKGDNFVLKHKSIPPLSTQVYMVRTILDTIPNLKECKKHVDSSTQASIQTFLNESALFTKLINFSEVLDECSQLETLWFKEFYIEISVGKHTQYPIEDSFPWIMMNYLLELSESDSYEFLLYLTCIYDDAAYYVLNKLKRRHLYDEIDSEAQLVFQQLCYHLSQRIYTAKRSEAFSILLTKAFKNRITKRLASVVTTSEKLNENNVNYSSSSQMFNVCVQRNVEYLGRKIDLNSLLSQRLLINFKQSLEACIGYFELLNVESVVMFSGLIEVYQEIHRILTLQFDVPAFNMIFNEVNGNMPGYLPRITSQILIGLLNDVAVNYSFCLMTERFVKSPVVFTDSAYEPPKVPTLLLFPSRSIANAFSDIYSIYSKYIGIEHFLEIFKLVGYSGVVRIVDEIKKFIASLIENTLQQYVGMLREGMPVKSILPQISYGFIGVIQYYNTAFDAIMRYQDLRPGVLHNLRVLGNYICIVYMLERAIYTHEGKGLHFTSALSGVVSMPTTPETPITNERISALFNHSKHFMFDNFPNNSIPQQFKTLLKKANELNQEKMCCGLSMFTSVMDFVVEKFDTPFWKGPEPPNGIVAIETCGEVHRIMSVLFYHMAATMKDPNCSVEYEFGDGIMFAAMTIIISVGQKDIFEGLDYCNHAITVSEVQSEGLIPMVFTSVFQF